MSSQDKPENLSPPLVSVSMTAYNSEKWLPRALDSVLSQKTSFAIEIIIGDDCSADGTIAVARFYQERYPAQIRLLERSKNIGMQRNYYETFEQCRGKYIAWLDADDYWTDPEKLEIQVKLLESDSSISACGHFARWVSMDGVVVRESFPAMAPGRYGLKEIIRSNFIPSPTNMFRNGLHRNLPPWFFDLTGLADWPILVVAGLAGDIVLIDRLMANYSLTPGSAYMSKDSLYQDSIDLEFCERMPSIIPSQWHRHVRASMGKRYESIAYQLRKKGNYSAARQTAFKALHTPDPTDNFSSKIKTVMASIVFEALWKVRGGRATA